MRALRPLRKSLSVSSQLLLTPWPVMAKLWGVHLHFRGEFSAVTLNINNGERKGAIGDEEKRKGRIQMEGIILKQDAQINYN